MIQAGDGLGLALKTLSENGIFGEMRRKNFDGDSTVQARVSRAVNFPHAARAKRRKDFVRPEFGASGQTHLFRLAIQLTTTVMGDGSFWGVEVTMMKRRPSA